MKKFRVLILAALAMAGVLYPASAQPAEPASWHALPVQHVRPGLLAWWLDHRHNAAPPEMASSREVIRTDSKKGAFQLPEGVSLVLPAEPRKELLVFATPAGLTAFKNIVALLDRPIRRAEVDAYYVEVSKEDAWAFGMDGPFQPEPARNQFLLGFVRKENFHATLEKLVEAGKARVLSAPKLTTLNNQRVAFDSSISKPGTVRADGIPPEIFKASLSIETIGEFAVTPTVNNDQTLTLMLEPSKRTRLKSADGAIIPLGSGVSVSTVANIRANDFLAFTGDSVKDLVPGEPLPQRQDTPQPERNVILFVTARSLEPVEEK